MLSEEGVSRLEAFLKLNEDAQKILTSAPSLKLPNWYLGAGCISQTVWNVLHGFSPGREIKDYDLVYYDSSDLSFETEDSHIQQAKRLFQNIPVPVEVRNEARVHLWYPEKFGFSINPYGSVEKAIASWPTTATCVGVKYVGKDFHVCAPYGLDDLFAMLVRPNEALIKKQVYEDKVKRWSAAWPKLRVIPWDE